MSETKLSAKQKTFVQEYLIDLNATQAAIRAGYSPRTATEQGSRLLTKAHVQRAIQEAQGERSRETARTALDVLIDIQATCREARQIGDLKTALRGYELEGRHLGMFRDRVELTGAIQLSASERAARIAYLLSKGSAK